MSNISGDLGKCQFDHNEMSLRARWTAHTETAVTARPGKGVEKLDLSRTGSTPVLDFL